MTLVISWPLPPPNWPDQSGVEVSVWAFALDVAPDALSTLAETLSPDERERAARFRFERHRNRFIAGRALLRNILGRYSEMDPAEVKFTYGQNGKPALVASGLAKVPQFNLAHSEDLALLAVSSTGAVGVDVERIRPLSQAGEMVARFFSPGESARFGRLPPEHQPAAFFNLWTRKEALLKATGEGIARSLSQVEVSFLPEEPAEFKCLPAHLGVGASWALHALAPAPGYIGALAVATPNARIQCWRWEAPGAKITY